MGSRDAEFFPQPSLNLIYNVLFYYVKIKLTAINISLTAYRGVTLVLLFGCESSPISCNVC